MGQLELYKKKKKTSINLYNDIPKRQEIYKINLAKLRTVSYEAGFGQDLQRLIVADDPNLEEINSFISKCKKYKIQEPEMIILAMNGNHYIEDNLIDKDFKIFELGEKILKNLNISNEEKEYYKVIKARFEKEFDDQGVSYINYDLDGKLLCKVHDLKLHAINNSLIFSDSNQPNILNLVLNEKLLKSEDLIDELSDFIKTYKGLHVVNLIINPIDKKGELPDNFGLDGLSYRMVYRLINAVTSNRNIKCFMLHCIKDYGIVLPPEICALILKKFQTETLVFFHLGNFVISEKYKKKFVFQFSVTRTLVLLSLEDERLTKEDVLMMANIFNKNKSIMALSLVSQPLFNGMKQTSIDQIKQHLKQYNKEEIPDNEKLLIVNLSDKSIVDFSQEEQKDKK